MEKYYDIKEEYLNILNESPELPSMPDIGEPDVIWLMGKNENLTLSCSENYSQEYLSKHKMLAELIAFFHLVSEGSVNVKQHE